MFAAMASAALSCWAKARGMFLSQAHTAGSVNRRIRTECTTNSNAGRSRVLGNADIGDPADNGAQRVGHDREGPYPEFTVEESLSILCHRHWEVFVLTFA